jgi:hypothetical protein
MPLRSFVLYPLEVRLHWEQGKMSAIRRGQCRFERVLRRRGNQLRKPFL